MKDSSQSFDEEWTKNAHRKRRHMFPNPNSQLEFGVLLIQFRQRLTRHKSIPVSQQLLAWLPLHFKHFVTRTDQTASQVKYCTTLLATTFDHRPVQKFPSIIRAKTPQNICMQICCYISMKDENARTS